MRTIIAVQGSPEWLQHRKPPMRNASESPNVMGEGYESRSEFMRQWVTGIAKEHDEATQARFAGGHRGERLAMPLMEEVVGESLYPIVGVNSKYGASFDGLTMAEDIGAEHKQLNDAIRSCKTAADLPLLYRIQMEVQCFVSGAEKILFMATNWGDDDTLLEKVYFWYYPDLKLRAAIDVAWDQFEMDAAAYTPPEVIPAAIATATLALPAVSIQVDGKLALISNLDVFGAKLKEFVDGLNTNPSDDQAFADTEAAIKTLQKAQDALEAAESGALAQTASIDEMRRTVGLYVETARSTRLMLEKVVKIRKEAIRIEIVRDGKAALASHISDMNKRLGKPYMPIVPENFAGVIKGQKTVTSLRDKVDAELARCKIEANAVADRIQINLNTLRDFNEYHFLFADTAQIVLKPNDDFAILVKSRITEHKVADAKREEAQRERIRKEEAERADREAAAKQQAEQDAMRRLNTEPAAQQVSPSVATAVHAEPAVAAAPTGEARLRALIAQVTDDFSNGELQSLLDAAREIRAARRQRVTA